MSSSSKIFILVFCTVAVSCSSNDDPYAPVYPKFNNLEYIELKLDESKFIDIYPDKYQIISDGTNEGLYHVSNLGDQLIAVKDQFRSIKLFNKSTGSALNEFSFIGNGPGEYQMIMDLVSDSNHILIFDGSSFKINRYSKDFEYLDAHVITGINPFGNVDYKYPYLVYSIRNDEYHLIQIMNLENPLDTKSIHNRIIRIGKQPTGYNATSVSISPSYDLAVMSGNMPLLFIYKDVLVTNTTESGYLIRLQHEDYNMVGKPLLTHYGGVGSTFENPPPIEIDLPEGKVIGFTPMFQDVVMVDEWIFIKEILNNRLVVLNYSDTKIRHHASYRFTNVNGIPLKWSDISYSNEWIYFGSNQGIIKVKTSELISTDLNL